MFCSYLSFCYKINFLLTETGENVMRPASNKRPKVAAAKSRLRVSERSLSSLSSLYIIYTSHHVTPHGRNELNKLTSLPTCGFIAQLVEHPTGIAEVTGSNPVEALIFFQASFQLLKLENKLRWSFFTFFYTIFKRWLLFTCYTGVRGNKIPELL